MPSRWAGSEVALRTAAGDAVQGKILRMVTADIRPTRRVI